MKIVKELEKDRIYCHHELEHALDVARMAWIYCLESQGREACRAVVATESGAGEHGEAVAVTEVAARKIPGEMEARKDKIYVCALLHDIGRAAQYETGVHHSVSGISLAKQILEDICVPADWREEILLVLSEHHDGFNGEDDPADSLESCIRRADHNCRLCFFCEAQDTCKWALEERNCSIDC